MSFVPARSRGLWLALAVVVTVGLLAPTTVHASTVGVGSGSSAPVVRAKPRHLLVGVQDHAMWGGQTNADRRAMLDRLAKTGAKWVRIGVPWVMVQPRPPTHGDPGWAVWALRRIGQVVHMARSRGLRVSATFGRTPKWANHGLGTLYLPTQDATFAKALHFLAKRYRGRIGSWEIWNEPNHENYLKGASAADYTHLLCRAYPAVHSAAPGAVVVSGGTAGNDWRYVNRMYRAGAKPCFDVLATHPYNSDRSPYFKPSGDQPFWFQNVIYVRKIMRRHHDLATPVWFTEVGWSTHADPPGQATANRGVTPQQQAKYLVQLLKITSHRYPYVKRVSFYMDQDEPLGSLHKSRFGLFTSDLRPKPAVAALHAYLAGAH